MLINCCALFIALALPFLQRHKYTALMEAEGARLFIHRNHHRDQSLDWNNRVFQKGHLYFRGRRKNDFLCSLKGRGAGRVDPLSALKNIQEIFSLY